MHCGLLFDYTRLFFCVLNFTVLKNVDIPEQMKGRRMRKSSKKETGCNEQDKQHVMKSEADADGELYGYGETIPCSTLSESYNQNS